MKYLLPLVFFFLVHVTAFAQEKSEPKSPNRPKVIALPLLFSSPDTKVGGGAGGLLTFNMPNDSLRARRSSVTFGVAYTQLRQVLIYLPYQLFFRQQRYWLYGEAGYYRYVFNYFGVGNDYPTDFIEKYDANFPRLRVNALLRLRPGLYSGLRYVYDDYDITPRSTAGEIAEGRVFGHRGGRVSGLGALLNYDTRDVLFFPSKGWLVETMLYTEAAWTGGQFRNDRLSVDAARYIALPRKLILALHANLVLSRGTIPFHQLPFLGGTKKLRGYFERKYTDNNLALLQAELRFPLFWRFSGVLFGGAGTVAGTVGGFRSDQLHPNYGLGLRILMDKQQRINARLDYGLGYKSDGFYLTVGEAF
jgi:hypothetical protein